MERRPLKTRNKKWVGFFTQALLKTNIKPDQISILGIGFALLAGVCFFLTTHSSWHYGFLFAAVFIQLRLLCNMMDGLVAVEGKRQSVLGDVFNELPDRYEDIFILACAGFASGNWALGWVAATFAVVTAYVRALGATVGAPQFFAGPMAKPHRMFVLTIACLFEFMMGSGEGQFLQAALVIIVTGCIVTAFRRRLMIVEALKSK